MIGLGDSKFSYISCLFPAHRIKWGLLLVLVRLILWKRPTILKFHLFTGYPKGFGNGFDLIRVKFAIGWLIGDPQHIESTRALKEIFHIFAPWKISPVGNVGVAVVTDLLTDILLKKR